jgi:hypothetical protein
VSGAQRVEESDDGILAFISCELDSPDQLLTLSIPPSRPEETAALSPLFLISCPTFLASSSKTTFELDSCEEGAGKDGLVKALVERATGRERGRVERRRSIVGGQGVLYASRCDLVKGRDVRVCVCVYQLIDRPPSCPSIRSFA